MFVNPDGSTPDDEPRPPMRRRRGRRLSDEQVREVNDLMHYVLTEVFGLSRYDAMRVLQRRVSDRRVRHRQGELRDEAGRYGVFRIMAEVIRDAG